MADTDPVNLSMGAARATHAAVRAVQRMPKNETGKPRHRPTDDGGATVVSRVVFSIASYDSGSGVATCYVEYRPYGAETVYGETGGQIDVIDPAGCSFDESAYDLIGRWGNADLMVADGGTDPEWVCSNLCCPS